MTITLYMREKRSKHKPCFNYQEQKDAIKDIQTDGWDELVAQCARYKARSDFHKMSLQEDEYGDDISNNGVTCDDDDEYQDDIDYSILSELACYYHNTHSAKELRKISSFYGLPYRRTKNELVEQIIDFESEDDNIMMVIERKELWETEYDSE